MQLEDALCLKFDPTSSRIASPPVIAGRRSFGKTGILMDVSQHVRVTVRTMNGTAALRTMICREVAREWPSV